MKKILLPAILFAVVFTACKTEQSKDIETSRQLMLTPDTSNLYKVNTGADVAKDEEIAPEPKQNNYAAPRKRYQPKYNAPVQHPAPVVTAAPPVVTAPVATTTPEVITTAPVATAPSESTNAPVAKAETKKKGISDAAKGAAIGGVGGAIAGAVIGKNGKGAILGGVIGAAGGYILGRQKDKKANKVEYVIN